MKTERGWFSVVRFRPRLDQEVETPVGLVLFCPESTFLEMRLSSFYSRLAADFPGPFDARRLETAMRGLKNRFQEERSSITTPDDLTRLLRKDANNLVFTHPLEIDVWRTPREMLNDLYQRAVEERLSTRNRSTANKRVTALLHSKKGPVIFTGDGSPIEHHLLTY